MLVEFAFSFDSRILKISPLIFFNDQSMTQKCIAQHPYISIDSIVSLAVYF
jgi:hypothetical protein